MAKPESVEDDFRLPAEREADGYAWEAVSEDEGEEIDFSKEKVFVGRYKGVKVVGVLNPETMVKEPTNLYLFEDVQGTRRSAWGNFRLDAAFAEPSAPVPGDMVKMEWHGKTDIGSGRTMNRLSVFKAAAR